MTYSRLVLGLDLGVTSVGWALLGGTFNENNQVQSQQLVDCGVRIFPATTEAKSKEPKNAKRRLSRGTRRLLRRKRDRRNKLRDILASNGLLPKADSFDSAIFHNLGDPYQLRSDGLERKLEPHEIGRAFYHLSKRRGFQSNRKSGKAKEDGPVLTSIAQLKSKIENASFKTLGSYLATQDKKRRQYTHREMTKHEFEALWETQKQWYPDILTDELRYEIHTTIFYQRPLQSQRGLIGKCIFEKDKKRCDVARQMAQRFRYWQDINNLQIQDRKTLDWRKLTKEEKEKLAAEFEKKKEISYTQLRKLLKIGEESRVNLETNEKKLKGNTTAYYFRKVLGKTWDSFETSKQERLVEEMFRIENEDSLKKRLIEHWGFEEETVKKLIDMPLEQGHSRLSLKAINKILPLMQREGLRYDEAASKIYTDHRRDPNTNSIEKLPPPPKDLRNPIVLKALHELRKVINAIIREYGKPDEIRIELARDLKMNAKQKDRFERQQRKNKKANEDAADYFKLKFGLENVSGTDKLKYRLWKETGETCPYTGNTIPPEMLLTDQCDIDHIIPYGRSYDDSYMNKTICDARFNREEKRSQTPFEVLGHDPQKYGELLSRIGGMPRNKQERFKLQEINEDEWIGRQLSDTRYISREARSYLVQLYDSDTKVQAVTGGSTALLRYHWGINSILSNGNVEEKNRGDHRHHVIDAIVVALTTRSLFQNLSRLAKRNEDIFRKPLKGIEMPWESFLTDVNEKIESLVVSHAQTRRVRGELFDRTAYGPTQEEGVYVVRKELKDLTAKMISSIVDPEIKKLVEARLAEAGGDLKAAFADSDKPLMHKDGITKIGRVRILVPMSKDVVHGIRDESGGIYKYYPSAANHHVEIYENADGERKVVLVSRFQAMLNIRESVSRGQKASPLSPTPEGYRFLFSLCPNDYVEFLGDDGKLGVYRVQKMSIGPNINIRPLEDTGSDYIKGVTKEVKGSKIKNLIRKLQVDPLGRLTQAND